MSDKEIVTRFAPSPTGFIHIGGLRTAAYAYALAKKAKGKFILRIEDTDQKREVSGSREKIKELLKIFNLNWDEYYVQSERVKTGIYKEAAEKMLKEGHAFYCFCKPKTKEEIKADQGKKTNHNRDICRNLSKEEVSQKLQNGEVPAIRLKIPDTEIIEFYDFVIRKKSSWKSTDVPDAMLLKSDGFPTYHLAMPVDDHDMHVSHVIRAMEWFSSTPIHVLIFKYLGYDLPEIGHPSAILDPAGGKLSKRKGNVSVEEFLKSGYLPEALFNFIILLGWAPKDNRELFSLNDFVSSFDINGFQKSNPVFNTVKLDWFNAQYIAQKSDNELASLLVDFAPEGIEISSLEKIAPLIKTRIKRLSEFMDLAGFFFEEPKLETESFSDNFKRHLEASISALSEITDWNTSKLNEVLLGVSDKNEFHRGHFFMDLRIAVTGRKVSLPLNESMEILGKEKVIERLKNAIQ